MMLRQVWLREVGSTTEQVCWIEADPRIKVGTHLTLDNEWAEWEVLELYGRMEMKEINRKWEVGGL